VEWQNQGYQNGVGNYLRVWDTNNPASKSELIDMNGDGRPDRVLYDRSYVYNPQNPQPAYWKVYLNNGDGFDSNFMSWINPSAWGTVNGNYIRNEAVINGFSKGSSYDVIDMNGDGLPDRVVYDKTSPYNTWTVYFNSGGGFGPSTDWSNPSGINHIETWDYSTVPCMGTGVIDMNGDGLPDRVVKNRSTGAWTVYFSTGSGFGPATSWPIQGGDQGGGCIRTVEFGATLADLIDMNGDGLPDRFASGYGVYYNTGSGFGPLSAWPILGSGLYATSVSDQYGTYASVFDITGDGLPDQVVSYVDNPPPNNFWYWFIHPNLGPLPDLLQKVENGIGGTIEFSYKPSTEYPNNYLPFVVQTASSIKTNDGNGVISTTNYTYEGGYFSATEREFRGFEYVKQTKPDQTTVETWYYTGSDPQTEDDDILKGFPYDQITKGSTGSTYLQAHNTYNITSPYTNVNFPYLERKDEYEYDGYGDPPRQSAIAFTYDSYGNVTRKQSLGDVSISTDDKDENTEYFYNATKWIVSLPTSKDIKDYTGAIKAKTWFEYDQGLRDKGNLTQKTLWLAGNQTDPANPVYNYTYDPSYGNLIAITDPKTNTTTLSYDTVTNTYPYQITNSKGHLNVLTYSPKFGKLLTVTDLNTNTTTYEYDVFGRLKKTKRPYDEQSIYGTVTYNYENFGTVGQQRIATLATEQSGTSNYLWKETYFDGLGRMIKTRQEGPDGKVNLTKTEYNTRGFIYRTSLPYFENLETTRWKTFAYDPMGRVMQITYPDNTSTTITHVKGVTTIIDQNGHQKKEKRDVFKRLATVEEYTGSNPNFTLYAITNYGYDVLDNNVSVTDAATPANVTTMVYDPLSRKIEMTDPDMGFWEYEYDKNNNLTSQTDAKNVTITYLPEGYDELNRPKVKHYPVGEIVYTYDEGFPFTNSLGRLTTVTDESGTTKLYYDKLGRVTKTIKTVDEIDYTIETTYDPLDRTRTIKYPDNETVTFTYDTGGNLGSIPGYVTSYTNYNALGQPGTITYPNGVVTTKTYRTDNNRLNRILTSPSYQDLTYGYDNKGNVASIADALDATRGQSFTYDELDRLRFAISSSYGTIEYQYSQIGNMTLNSQVGSYLYQSPKPHAVTRAGSIDYTYDPNGNMETGAGRTIVSNYDNKPSSITIGGATTSFIYDYQGQRVKKISGGLPTLYIGKLYECTSGVCTKYIFGGITRIDLKAPAEPKDLLAFGGIGAVGEKQEAPFGAIGTKFIADVYAKQTIENEQRVALKSSTAICGSNILYYHTDHLGSSNVITNVSGGNAEGVYYYPFGATRLQTGGDCVNHKFTGQEEDGETGLYNYGARYYDPVLGRFTSADSIVPDYTNPQALNRYSYVLNNPLKYIDPTGQEATDYDYYGTDPPGASENPADSRSTENDPTQLAQIFSDEDDRMLDNFLPVDPEKEEKKQIEREKQRAERDAVRGAALRAAAEIAIEILGFFYGFETPKGFFDPDRDFEHGPNRDPN
jgi:RHS repeat-associated protein